MIIDPLNFEGFNQVFTGVIVPRPIAFVSSMSADGLVKGLIYLMPLQPFLLHVKTADGIRCNPEFGAVIP